jgi:hypothetical protein
MLFVTLDPSQGAELDKLAEFNKILLRYHSPTCTHCVQMEPEWDKVKKDKRIASSDITIVDANVGIVDGTKHPSAKDVSKKGVPTIYLIDGNDMKEHTGDRNQEDIVSFVLENSKQSGGKKKKKKIIRRKTRTKSRRVKAKRTAKKQKTKSKKQKTKSKKQKTKPRRKRTTKK